jgi:hypothetical protein
MKFEGAQKRSSEGATTSTMSMPPASTAPADAFIPFTSRHPEEEIAEWWRCPIGRDNTGPAPEFESGSQQPPGYHRR